MVRISCRKHHKCKSFNLEISSWYWLRKHPFYQIAFIMMTGAMYAAEGMTNSLTHTRCWHAWKASTLEIINTHWCNKGVMGATNSFLNGFRANSSRWNSCLVAEPKKKKKSVICRRLQGEPITITLLNAHRIKLTVISLYPI